MSTKFITDDFVRVRKTTDPNSKDWKELDTAFYGDPIEIKDGAPEGWTKVRYLNKYRDWDDGYIRGRFGTSDTCRVLKFSMVDVQQGDGMVIETPEGKVILIDGGDNELFARHLARRFFYKHSEDANRVPIDAIIVTHGDADHFEGLSYIQESEKIEPSEDDTKEQKWAKKAKRIFINPERVYHNGLVKGPGTVDKKEVKDRDLFGQVGKLKLQEGEGVVNLHDNLFQVPDAKLNLPFQGWKKTLQFWQNKRGQPIEMRRLYYNMSGNPFEFLQPEGIKVEILGPFQVPAFHPETNDEVPALPFFHNPPKSAHISLLDDDDAGSSISASHTINGHSIAMRLSYGNVRFLLTGDMNQESLAQSAGKLGPDALQAEILKAPHHGSHDFSLQAVKAASPVVALVSSGDESLAKEFIHPRATLMSALGQCMQGDIGLVFCTELTAFFTYQDEVFRKEDILEYFKLQGDRSYTTAELAEVFTKEEVKKRKTSKSGKKGEESKKPDFARLQPFHGFERYNFGIVHVRTDGERVLVFTNSAEYGTYEAYAFTVTRNAQGERVVKFEKEVRTSGK